MKHEIKQINMQNGTIECSCGKNHPFEIKNYESGKKNVSVIRIDTSKNFCDLCKKIEPEILATCNTCQIFACIH